MMDKLKLHTPDFTDANIAKLAELFPACVTESHDENRGLKKAIDFDQLRQELSHSIVEGPRERYHLDWPGKREALLAANAPIAKTLRPCQEESVDFDTTKNLFIEGDNLDALKLLQETYLNKVKMIYIDPPYNTGKDFIYDDNYSTDKNIFEHDSGLRDKDGKQLLDQEKYKQNYESNGRFHSDWMTMIYPRIKLARNLLHEDGVIFISIDDGEVSNIRKVCDEIFGELNFLGCIVWKKKTNGNNMGYIPPVHDYFLCYGKTASEKSLLGFPLDKEFLEKTYSNPDNDPRGSWTTTDLSANHKGPHFSIKNPDTEEIIEPPEGRYWVFNEKEVLKRINDGRIIFGKNGKGRPVQKKFLSERFSLRRKPESWWDKHGMNEDGSAELGKLLGPKVFDHPKPSLTLKHLINISTENDDLILDFFSGSSSTAHAAMSLNSEDAAKRRYIMMQLPEICDEKSNAYEAGYKTIAELGKERIRRAGKKIKEESADKENIDQLDIGFRVLKIDSSNMKEVYYTPDLVKQDDFINQAENIREDRTSEDLLFQVLLDWGVDLSLSIKQETISDKTVFFVDGSDESMALAACFDKAINEDFVKQLATRKPLRVVFKDAGFENDSVKINIEQIFKLMSPNTEVKTI